MAQGDTPGQQGSSYGMCITAFFHSAWHLVAKSNCQCDVNSSMDFNFRSQVLDTDYCLESAVIYYNSRFKTQVTRDCIFFLIF